ncbi:MAG TPA: lysophospholipid acyltransferase family protein, partial [Leptospiraceae bacterium]|nr:lysophospholipid acyltransferase family protein [Leptospiraceae bacterium]
GFPESEIRKFRLIFSCWNKPILHNMEDTNQTLRIFAIPLEPARQVIRALMDRLFKIEVSGVEHIPLEGGGIIVCNHTDLIDVPVQAVHSPRRIVYFGKAELFEPDEEVTRFLFQEGSFLNMLPGIMLLKPVLSRFLSFWADIVRAQMHEWGGRPIVRNFRGGSARESVEYYRDLEDYMVQLIKEGNLISLYPEGTRTDTGVMAPFKALAAKLAIRAQAPIIPTGITGSFGFLTPQSILSGRIFSTKIHYNVGKPIPPSEFPKTDEKKAAKELTAELEKQVYALTLHPERRDHARGKTRVL